LLGRRRAGQVGKQLDHRELSAPGRLRAALALARWQLENGRREDAARLLGETGLGEQIDDDLAERRSLDELRTAAGPAS